MKFRIKDKRFCDYLDYFQIGKTLTPGKTLTTENNGITYEVKFERMTPLKYIRSCAEMMGISIERLISSRNDDSLKKLPIIPKEYLPKYRVLKTVEPSKNELEENNRARSAKLRIIDQDNYGIIYIDNFNKMQDGLHRAIILMMKQVPNINVLVIRKIS